MKDNRVLREVVLEMVARSSTPSNWRALLTRPEVLVGSEVSTMLLVPRFPVFPLPLESVTVRVMVADLTVLPAGRVKLFHLRSADFPSSPSTHTVVEFP